MPPHTGSDPGGSRAPGDSADTAEAFSAPQEYTEPPAAAAADDDADDEAEREKQQGVTAAAGHPFIGPLIPLEHIRPEIIRESNAMKKISFLCSQQQQQQQQQQGRGVGAQMRRVKRDGCCFYRSYMFGVFEHIVGQPAEIKKLKCRVKDVLVPQMLRTGYTKEAIEEFVDEVQGALAQLEEPSANIKDVEMLFNEKGPSNYLVVFARLLTASQLRSDADLYQPFLSCYSSIDDFCIKEVEPMWVGAEQPQILALATAFGFPVEIFYVDQSPGEKPARHVFPESPNTSVKLLYRPGHYDLLYL